MSDVRAALLSELFAALQAEMLAKLTTVSVHPHPDAKGDQSEVNWAKLLDAHLPQRYRVLPKATVVDHYGNASQEIDLLVIDRQYSPLIFHSDARAYVPAESVYAALECKQGLNRANVDYAADKVASVRSLERTSAPVPHAGGVYAPREPGRIIGGLLTSRADWTSGLGASFTRALRNQDVLGQLDIGCALVGGGWSTEYDSDPAGVEVSEPDTALTYFMLTLQARLQAVGTVPAIDFALWREWIPTHRA
ncbi:DUF6602 domain-containing protein [Geodermatophilus sp. SYSU D01119]